jgi:hypothetical protein
MTEISNNLSLDLDLNNNNEEVIVKKTRKPRTQKELICYKCAIPIEDKISKFYICRDCYNTIAKLYYKNKIKPNKIPVKRKKITFQKDYTLPNGDVVQVNLKSENKTCNKCLIEKNYTEFYTVIDRSYYYLQPKCKNCVNKN